MMLIQAMKGVGIGDGFALAAVPGSQAHDEIFYSEERGFYRETNHAGGLEGGMTTGTPLVVRVAMKPIPTLTKPLRSVDIDRRSRRRRCASGATPAPSRRPASSGRRCSPACSPTPTAQVRRRPHRRRPEAVRAYEERIGWRRH